MITGEAAEKYMFTWLLAGSGLLEAAGAFCLLRPLGPEPQQHLPPKHTQYTRRIRSALPEKGIFMRD